MTLFRREEIEAAHRLVHQAMPATPQYAWPLLARRLGAQVWVKHENHTPVGAFKLRGGLVYLDGLRRREPRCTGVISATRGNHGQSMGFAARRHGLSATIVVPHGNSLEKNAAMRELGVELLEHGDEFQAAREHAQALAAERGLHMVPSFHADLVLGVCTGWVEFFSAVQPDVLFVPVGMGSGLCAAAVARRHTGVHTRLIGVVSSHALAYRLSFEQGRAVEAPVTTQLADGMACRSPDPQALEIIRAEAEDIVCVSDAEVAEAMRALFADTHNVAEGAGAAAFAAAMQQRERWRGKTVGVALTGGNVDSGAFAQVLACAAGA
ncbi:threonine dehydratase [Schlegelella sp. S2-27]|uniref:Threonine dehydratase n=2 Tax=Caldimonas mangrovi TaxID=2944811 RepID=A0ABT0YSG5_9BURK|nr:threonine dehydratase [Caldimonas mangrovi]MCM5681682.1 threonine dehydratase [Caldimonas mangrovi]